MANASDAGVEALRRLKSTDPPSWLAPNVELSEAARTASQYLFSTLKPFSPKSPLDQLLVEGFDAEQIWQQIDLQSQPLLSTLRRRLKQLSENPEGISQLKVPSKSGSKVEENSRDEWEGDSDGFDEELDEEEEGDEDEEKEGEEEGMEVEEEDEVEEEEENEDGGGIEDKFLKIDELAKYLDKEEEDFENGEADREGEEEDDDEESDEDGDFGSGDEDDVDEEAENMESARCLLLCSH